MANLSEQSVFEAGIYQIETTDPILGGAEGISNRQAKQLANRTLFLKQQLDAASSGLDTKRAIADSYSKAEVDGKISSLTKTNVGLSNVDNTTDLAKPISTATQTALNAKRNISDSYTKTEVDTSLDAKRNVTDSYTKTETEALIASNASGLGVGQTWQDVKASRALDIVYTNSTGKPIMINVVFVAATTRLYNITKIEVDGCITASYFTNYNHNSKCNSTYHSVIIPPNCTYKALKVEHSGDITLEQWAELR